MSEASGRTNLIQAPVFEVFEKVCTWSWIAQIGVRIQYYYMYIYLAPSRSSRVSLGAYTVYLRARQCFICLDPQVYQRGPIL